MHISVYDVAVLVDAGSGTLNVTERVSSVRRLTSTRTGLCANAGTRTRRTCWPAGPADAMRVAGLQPPGG